MKKQLAFFLVFSCAVLTVSAQQRIGDASTGSKLPNKDAILELESKNKALLVSRIALSSTTVATPLSAHTAGMIAYNTATINDVVPGIYYNDGTKWLLVGKGETTNIKYDPTTHIISYIDGAGNTVTIDIEGIVRGSQTVTKVVAEVLNGKNTGKYTYYNEKEIDKNGNIVGPGTVINVVGDVQNNFQDIVNNTEVKNIFETIVKNTGGNVSYNATTNSFTYVDGTGTTQTINITDMVKTNETVTKVVAEVRDGKNTGKYTYYNEKDIDKDGNITGPGTVINVVGDVQNNFQDIVNNTEVKNIFETIVKNTSGNVSYDATNNNFTYVDGNGVTQTINITDMVKTNETVTKVVAEVRDGKNTGKYTYYNEKDIDKDGNITGPGTVINVVGDVQNNFQDIVNNTEVKNTFETIVKNTGGNVSYDATNNNFTYVDGNGVTQTINITDMVQNNQKTSSVTGTGLANVTSSTTGNNTNYTVDVTATAVQVAQKTSSVEGTTTASVSSAVSGNNTAYTVSVPTASTTLGVVKEATTTPTVNIASDGTLSVNTTQLQANQKTSSVVSGTTTTVSSATTGNNTAYTVEINPSSVQNSQKLTTLSDGNITTVAATTSGNTTDYKVNVPTASTTLGVVKQATTAPTVDIASDGTLSVNTTQLQANQKTSSVTGTGLANVTSSTTGNNTNYTVDVTATAVQVAQKTSSVTKGDYTTVATTTPTTNNTDYKVDVDPSTLIGDGLKLNATTKKIDVDFTTIPNVTDKTATVANGNNTTVTTDATNPNNPIYKVNVAIGSATTLGVVKEAATPTVNIAADGSLSVNTTQLQANQKTSSVVNGTNTTVSSAPNATDTKITEYKVNVPTANGTSPGVVKQGDGTVVVGTGGELSINLSGTGTPGDPGAGKDLISSDLDITNGTGATLTAVTADIKAKAVTPAKMADAPQANQILVSDANKLPVWIDQTTVAQSALKFSNGTNTTLNGNGTVATPYKYDVATANGTNLGVVKEAATNATVKINNSGELSINLSGTGTPGDPGAGKDLISSDLDITNGTGATLTAVTADIKAKAVTPAKMADAPQANQILVSDANKLPVWIDQTTVAQSALKFSNGTNTTLNGNGTVATPYKYDVATANGTNLGVVKQAAPATATVNIAADGVLSINTANVAAGLGKNFTSTDLTITGGLGATLTPVTADIKADAVTTGKILDGTISNADINAAAAIAVTKLANGTNGQVLTTNGSVPTWTNPSALAINNLYTSNGSLTADRIVDLNAHTLTFKDNIPANAGAQTTLYYTNGNASMLHSAPASKRSEIILQANTSALNIFQDPGAPSQIITSGTSTSLNIGTGTSNPMTLATNSAPRMIVAANGNIGMGTGTALTTPSNVLHVNATNPLRLEGLQGQAAVASNQLIVADNTGVLKTIAAAGNNQMLTTNGSGVPTWTNQSTIASSLEPWRVQGTTNGATSNADNIYQTGNVAIGATTAPAGADASAKLYVNGTITTANSLYADYVFEDYFEGASRLNNDYTFKSLKEIEEFIYKNKHLPGVTGIKGLAKNDKGEYVFNISKLSVQLLEKVEELYLHTIEQQKKLDIKDKEIQDLKAQQQKTEERLKRLEEAVLGKANK